MCPSRTSPNPPGSTAHCSRPEPQSIIKPRLRLKWMLDDPRVNFAISTRGGSTGLDHLGIQVETPDELGEGIRISACRRRTGPCWKKVRRPCCYAQSEKSWITDPQGLSWETFLTSGESTVYGDSVDLGTIRTAAAACCTPQPSQDAWLRSGRVSGCWRCCAGQPHEGHPNRPSRAAAGTSVVSQAAIVDESPVYGHVRALLWTLWVALCIVVGIALGAGRPRGIPTRSALQRSPRSTCRSRCWSG